MRNIVEFLIRVIRKRPNFSFDEHFTIKYFSKITSNLELFKSYKGEDIQFDVP